MLKRVEIASSGQSQNKDTVLGQEARGRVASMAFPRPAIPWNAADGCYRPTTLAGGHICLPRGRHVGEATRDRLRAYRLGRWMRYLRRDRPERKVRLVELGRSRARDGAAFERRRWLKVPSGADLE